MRNVVVEAFMAVSVAGVLGVVAVNLQRGRTPLDFAISAMVRLRAGFYLLQEMKDAAWRRRDRWPECLDKAWSKR
jgi:hypothetical protein